ncbi:MAG: T9SS type A sorting domain-containing protein, partial [bacterium]
KITQEVEKFPDILASPIAVDKDYVWFATYKGAYRYDKANDTFERFGEEVGLVNIYAVAADENSVWFGGANGAYRYDKINKIWRHYTPENSRLGISYIAEIGIDAESVWFRDDYSATRYYKYSEDGNNILFKQEIPINIEKGETNKQEIEIGTLSAKGKLYLEASLSSSLSQNIALPVIYPFYIFPSAIELFLAPDKKIYWPGEIITIFGTVSNKGTVSEELNLNLMCNNEPLFTASFTLSPQASYLFVATKTADSSFMLKGEVKEVKISERIIVEQPSLDVSIISSEVVGRGTQSLSILFKNKGKRRIDLDFSLNLQGLITKGSISIEGGESKIIEQWFSILEDGTITVVLSGDVVGIWTKFVEFGEKVELSLNPEPVYPYPFIELPFALENKGKMDSEFEVSFKLEKEGNKKAFGNNWCKAAKIIIGTEAQRHKGTKEGKKSKVKIQGDSVLLIQPFFVQAGSKIEGTLVYELSTGTYKLSYDYFRGTGTRQFKVAKNNLARIEDMVLGKENEKIKVDVFVSNQGGNDFMGNLALSSSFFKQEKAIEIKKAEKGTHTFLLEPNVSKGTYTIMGEVLYNGEGIFKREEIFSLTPDFRLKELAYPGLIVGEIATLTFTIENIGFVEDRCDFSFALLDLIDFKDSLFLSSDCEKTIMIPFSIPDDFEDGTFTGELRINEKRIEIPLNIRGIKIGLLAYLDKILYKLDDPATLTLRITNLSKMGSLSMFAKVRLNGYEEERAFSLYGSNTLTFTFKVTGFSEKLFYGIYTKEGRAIHLNSLYLNQENEVISLWTDQDVYKMGETMTIYAKANIPGTLTINGLDYSREEYITQTFTDTFVLPKNLFSGTYYLYYSLGTYTFEKPFDVYGKETRVIKEELDRKVYKKKDTMELRLIFLSNFSDKARIKGWMEDPKGNYSEVFSENLSFQEGRNAFNVKAPFQTQYSGMHKLVYGIYLKESGVRSQESGVKGKGSRVRAQGLGILENNDEELIAYGYCFFDVEENPLHHLRIECPDTITTYIPFTLSIFLEDLDKNPVLLPDSSILTTSLGTITIPANATYTQGSFTILNSFNYGIATLSVSLGTSTLERQIFVLINPEREQAIRYGNLTLKVKGAERPFYFKIDDVSTISLLSSLPNHLGICYSIRAFGTQGEIFSPFLIIPEIQLGSITENLRLYVFKEDIWKEIPSYVLGNTIYGTLTHLCLLAPGCFLQKQSLDGVIVFPNPARVYRGEKRVYFSNLPKESTIKIFNIAGELLERLSEENNEAIWDVRDIASGVYLYLIQDVSSNKRIGKIGVIK